MRNYRFGARKILVLTSLLAGLSLTGCDAMQGSLHAITVHANTSAPSAVTASTISADTTAPVIDALDITIPYGSFLRLADIATITDDQDESPVLEIVSVTNADDKASQNTTASAGSTENAASAGSTESAASTGSTKNAAAAVTAETTAEAEPTEPGYLFSTPGKYNMLLKGTDKSGNESTKTITVTVTDKVAPVFEGLQESFELTDKDKTAPDYLGGIKATDEIDGDITAAIKVDDSNVQYCKVGSYSITYTATDKSGNKAVATIPVTINDTTAPYFTVLASALNLFVTDEKPNYTSLITAIDAVDGDVKDSLTVDDEYLPVGKLRMAKHSITTWKMVILPTAGAILMTNGTILILMTDIC